MRKIDVSIMVFLCFIMLPNVVYSLVILPYMSEAGVTTSPFMFKLPAIEVTSPLIVDNDVNTGIILFGQDGIVEYGAFARFVFNVGNGVSSLTFNISVSSNVRTIAGGNIAIRVWNYSTSHYAEVFTSGIGNADISDGIDSFSIKFTATGHNGNSTSFYSEANLYDILAPDGTVSFLVYGPFYQSIDQAGLPKLYLNEVNVEIAVVPEPISFILFIAGGVFLVGMPYLGKKKL